MTDFDFEILEAIAFYSKDGVERTQLEREHFAGYNLLYNLEKLAETKPITAVINGKPITVTFEDSACLKKRTYKSKKNKLGMSIEYEFYSLTFKGQSLLQNWQRQRAKRNDENRRRERNGFMISCLVGIITGIIATVICSKFLGL